jgi:thiaminase
MLNTTTYTIAVTSDNDKQIKELEKSINLIIAESLPYYKSIFKAFVVNKFKKIQMRALTKLLYHYCVYIQIDSTNLSHDLV